MICKPLLIPPLPGSYILHLRLEESARFTAGKLGAVRLPAGDYFYCGSAQGPGGLRARLERHLCGSTRSGTPARPHWHIDALRALAQPVGFCYQTGQPRLECEWSQALARLPGAFLPAPGFGSSDCRRGCRSHLVGTGRIDLLQKEHWLALLGDAGEITAGVMPT